MDTNQKLTAPSDARPCRLGDVIYCQLSEVCNNRVLRVRLATESSVEYANKLASEGTWKIERDET